MLKRKKYVGVPVATDVLASSVIGIDAEVLAEFLNCLADEITDQMGEFPEVAEALAPHLEENTRELIAALAAV